MAGRTKPCACGCGRLIPTHYQDPSGRWHPRKYYDRKRCTQRARRKHAGPPAIRACDCGCGKTFPERTKHGRPRRWHNQTCRHRVLEEVKAPKRAREAHRRTAQLGRVCYWCGRRDDNPDDPRPWGSGDALSCENCRRQRSKSPCTICGGPFYVYPHKPSGRLAGCVLRNRLGSCAIDE